LLPIIAKTYRTTIPTDHNLATSINTTSIKDPPINSTTQPNRHASFHRHFLKMQRTTIYAFSNTDPTRITMTSFTTIFPFSFTPTHTDMSFPARLAAQLNNGIAAPVPVAQGGNVVHWSTGKATVMRIGGKRVARWMGV
jgi:hypothetical protein